MKTNACFACGKSNLGKNTEALNKKMLGRNIEKFFCLNCLANYLGVTVDDLFDKIKEFKDQGCTLFKLQ